MPDISWEIVGMRVRDVRLQKNLSSKELASMCGISDSCVSRVERGNPPSLKTIISIAKLLDVSLDYLIMGSRAGISSKDLTLRSDEELILLFQKENGRR